MLVPEPASVQLMCAVYSPGSSDLPSALARHLSPSRIRTLALSGIEVLFVPAQWPDVRRYHWETLLAARAIENQIFIAACNSCASDTHGGGSSRILDPLGSVLAALDTTEGVLSADIDLSVLADIRATINVYRDRRPELYQVSDTPLRF